MRQNRRSNNGIIVAIIALAAAIAYIFSNLFGGFGPGTTGGGAPAEVNVNVTVAASTETLTQTTNEGEAAEYVFNVPADGQIVYNDEPIDFERFKALVAEAAARRAPIRLIRDPSVSVAYGDQLREVINELNVTYVEE